MPLRSIIYLLVLAGKQVTSFRPLRGIVQKTNLSEQIFRGRPKYFATTNGETIEAIADGGSYTAELAYEHDRRLARTIPTLTESNSAIENALSLASLLTLATGIQVGVLAGILLSPSILYSRAVQKDDGKQSDSSLPGSSRNISNRSSGSRTAILALWARTQAHLQGSGGPDYLAPRLLDRLSLLGPNISGSQTLLSMCAQLSRLSFRLTRQSFEDQAAYIATLFNTGIVTPMQVRTCWFDDCVETFVRRLNNTRLDEPRANLVILGSGFDTRCYRLDLQNVQTYEVDASGTQSEKKRVLSEANIDTGNTIFCPCDFETQNWLSCLVDAGFNASLPTMFVWEGVTMYLPKTVVVDTLKTIASHCEASPWYLAFDYINSEWAMSPVWRRAMERAGEPFKFAMCKSEPEELVETCGLTVLEHLNHEQELADRYLPKHYSGRPIGILGRYGGFVVAVC